AGVPVSHVRSMRDVARDEQIVARNMVKPVKLASGREIPTWGVPVKMNENVASRMLAIPGVDQHRAEILAELDRLGATPKR
ncbi:MAG TPA: CoA transferase, partial [Burkholderiales bacterium]|nr:CoA transferase [Burkholderiales bacterium]